MQKTPPRFVPTLTQVVPEALRPKVAISEKANAPPDNSVEPNVEHISQQLRQQLLVRSRQYIDIELQRRIRETVSQLALEHAHKLYEELQPQLEATIRQVIDDAIAQAVAYASTHNTQ
jgi:hypothetical protein